MASAQAHRVLPPTNGSIPFESIVDFHLNHNPEHTWAILAGIDGALPVSISYEQLAYAVHRAAHILNPNRQIPQSTKIAILVSADTIVYVALVLGAIRAGLVPFPLSPRTQVAGISHLLLSTHTKHVVIGGSPVIDDLWEKVQTLSEADFKDTRLPSSSELFPYLNNNHTVSITKFPDISPTTDKSLFAIFHSSGSTGVPRPVEICQKSALVSLIQQSPARELANVGEPVGLIAFPTFHMAGFIIQCVWPFFAGYCPVFLPPSPMPVIPTAEVIMKALVSARCVSTIIAPSFLEIWMNDNNAISQLKRLRRVIFGGGPLAHWVGGVLASKGVPLRAAYGVTELGCISRFESPSYEQDNAQNWNYLEFSEQARCHFVPQNEHEETYELVVVSCAEHKPFLINCEIDGQPAYATKDLMVPHPRIPNLWKIIGRLDDQIVLANGEKVNPGAIEDEIIKSPLVEVATMFGRERTQTGLLIELVKTAHNKLDSKESRAHLIDEIWPFIDKANGMAPTHARLSKDAVMFAEADRPLPRTPKGTLSRSAALNMYAKDIDGMYAALERGDHAKGTLAAPAPSSTQGQIEEWLKNWLGILLDAKIDVGVDLFQQGLDSLTATFLFRELKKALGSSSVPAHQQAARKLVQETIFRNPTISQLSKLIVQPGHSPEEPREENSKSIEQFIHQFDLPATVRVSPTARSLQMEYIVLTGTTGGFGSHLLAQLLANDRVERVWALNRKSSVSGQSVQQRQLDLFKDKSLNIDLLRHPKLVLSESDLTHAKLGVPPEVYGDILRTATLVIHNAWQVNFNLSLQSFEPSIRGAQNLLDLALSSEIKPRFLFTSSVSAAGFGSPGRQLPETILTALDASTSIGYGQSKFVAEKLLESARTSGLETCSIRLGQLAGDTIGGAWSLTDWVPSVIASSVSSGYLPDAVGGVSWLPIDVAASSVIEIALSQGTLLPPILHCAHPHPTSWKQVISSFAEALRPHIKNNRHLSIVPFSEWLSHVNTSAAPYIDSPHELAKRFPSTKIQSTIKEMARADEELRRMKPEDVEVVVESVEAGGIARLLTTEAECLSNTLKNAPPLSQEDASRWVGYWSENGLFV